uniref:Uncharacterized protein n=1 Tax=Romanomermis culicivorax TaxID=13658 RepID=A0A915IMI2_ROMCU
MYPKGICYCYMPRIWEVSYNNQCNLFGLILNVMTLFIYTIVYWKNAARLRKINIETMNSNLNRRFIEWSCVKITKWLIPLTIISITPIGVVLTGFTIFRFLGYGQSLATFEASIFIVILFAFDASLYSYVCIWWGLGIG